MAGGYIFEGYLSEGYLTDEVEAGCGYTSEGYMSEGYLVCGVVDGNAPWCLEAIEVTVPGEESFELFVPGSIQQETC